MHPRTYRGRRKSIQTENIIMTQCETFWTIHPVLQPHKHNEPHDTIKRVTPTQWHNQKGWKASPEKRKNETKNLSQTFLSRSMDKVLQPRKEFCSCANTQRRKAATTTIRSWINGKWNENCCFIKRGNQLFPNAQKRKGMRKSDALETDYAKNQQRILIYRQNADN